MAAREANNFPLFLISSKMLREYYNNATRLHAEIIVSVPQPDRNTIPYFDKRVFTTVTNTFNDVDTHMSALIHNVSIAMQNTLNLNIVAVIEL